MLPNVRRYVLFASPDLRRGWRGFCNRGVSTKHLNEYLAVAPQSLILLVHTNQSFTA